MYVISVAVLFSVYTVCRGNGDITIIPRSQWGAAPPAKPPENISSTNLPVAYVVVHHSAANNNCSGKPCSEIVRCYQILHMDVNNWDDIGYNFLIGPNGEVFEGRGWDVIGAHAPKMNRRSVGICLIGNFEEIPPTPEAVEALQKLIRYGVDADKISSNYTIMGHNELQNTLCPGKLLSSIIHSWKQSSTKLNITSRSEWGAKPPKHPFQPIPSKYFPVPYTIIHHSAGNTNCSNRPCAEIVREIQKFHQDVRGWNDIGYNFLVSWTGEVFEGRGWDKLGAQAPNFNDKSMGICLIGDFENESPTPNALAAAQELISLGTAEGQISKKYILLGHRQVRATTCPGNALYAIVQKWSHWAPHP